MKDDKKLRDIELQTEFILAHVRRIRKSGKKLHPLDRDMLLNKMRDIYEKLLETEKEEPAGAEEKTIELPETMPEAGIPEKAESTKDIGKGELITEISPTEIIPAKPDEEEVVEKTPEQKTEQPYKQEEVVKETEEKKEPELPEEEKEKIIEKIITAAHAEETPAPEEKPEKPQEKEKPEPMPSLDLFSTAEETIAEKLAQKEESTVADKISKNVLGDLRQVIGINEKFLFINELFNGDMTRYNKVIDDLNNMQNPEGARRYLIELKVAGQWPDDLEAFAKLKELVERKFA